MYLLLWAADVLLCETDGNGTEWNQMEERGKGDEEENRMGIQTDERQGENE